MVPQLKATQLGWRLEGELAEGATGDGQAACMDPPANVMLPNACLLTAQQALLLGCHPPGLL